MNIIIEYRMNIIILIIFILHIGTDLSGKLAGLVSDTPAEERVY